MVFEKKPKIGIVVGLKSEKRTLSSKNNLFVESGYGKKAYNAAKQSYINAERNTTPTN